MSEPTPGDKFDIWWKKNYGDRMKGSRYLAKNAWKAAIEQGKPKVSREWIEKAIGYIAEYPSYHRLETKLREVGLRVEDEL